MLDVLIRLLLGSVLFVFMIISWHILLKKKINFKDYKLYVTFVGITLSSFINYYVTNNIIRIFSVTIIFILFFSFLFREKLYKCIMTPIFTQIIIFVSEFLYAIVILLLFGNDANKAIDSILGNFATNVVIGIMLYIIVNFKFIKNLYTRLLKITDKINSVQLGLFCTLGMLILNIALYATYTEVKIEYILLINVVITLLVLFIIFYSFKTQNKYNKVSNKYNVAIKSLNDYEDMMTKYRIANHENKNLLLTVRAMILNNDKDIPKYIDSIIKEKFLDDEKLLFDVSTIPSGGLRATIYSEILKIKENKINYMLNIDRDIRTVDLIELDTDTIVETCKIIGVFIDNAIEAVEDLKIKNINIELYIQNKNLYIKVSNNYKGNIDIYKISDEGYTTKGKGHGYGLSLVKSIVNNNSIFENITEINKKIFSQILIIKYKKTL